MLAGVGHDTVVRLFDFIVDVLLKGVDDVCAGPVGIVCERLRCLEGLGHQTGLQLVEFSVEFLQSVLLNCLAICSVTNFVIFETLQFLFDALRCFFYSVRQGFQMLFDFLSNSFQLLRDIIGGEFRGGVFEFLDGLVDIGGVVGSGSGGLSSRRFETTVQAVNVDFNGVQFFVDAVSVSGCLADVSCQF
ncbi:hypothetical membrane-anchored, putative [Babesia ovata]|uniref:Hypothetical membrane-anchored, putative n=1 Tax=Babesia ovata TaxID=189622 RepID=A0A2H6KKG8_9APIC|nr:hypothetical membrane-anchored, putative [Babesia ovata]GBE63486.1 hypothetical membrane-anchored, putative [Babesia ovata]